jgi:alkylation response protein AidB-like acyl-CoA dehydrogenase
VYLNLRFQRREWAAATIEGLRSLAEQYATELKQWTRTATFPRDLHAHMGELGWVGIVTPQEWGGSGGGIPEYCLIEEEVARLGLLSPQVSIQGQLWLLRWGTGAQKERYLPGIASGKLVFSESISEPGAGSSLKTMRTTARRSGPDWVISGHKIHVNLGHESDVTIVYAMAQDAGLTAFLVETDTPGCSSVPTDPVGLRLIPTAGMHFDDVRVPAGAVLGTVGGALDTFLSTFNISRLGNASELIGFGRRTLAAAARYAAGRDVGGQLVTDFQGIRWTVADAYSDLYGASLARDRAAMLAEAGERHDFEASLAKKLAVEAAEHAGNEAFALVGGHGLYWDTEFVQALLDTKVLRIAGGSLEVLRNHVAGQILRSESLRGLA